MEWSHIQLYSFLQIHKSATGEAISKGVWTGLSLLSLMHIADDQGYLSDYSNDTQASGELVLATNLFYLQMMDDFEIVLLGWNFVMISS